MLLVVLFSSHSDLTCPHQIIADPTPPTVPWKSHLFLKWIEPGEKAEMDRSLISPETASLAPHTFAWVFPPSPWSTHNGSVPKAACGRERCGGHPIRVVQTFLEARRGSQLLRLFWSLVSSSWPIPRAKDDLTSCQFLESE